MISGGGKLSPPRTDKNRPLLVRGVFFFFFSEREKKKTSLNGRTTK